NAASLDRQREAEDRLAAIAAAERELLDESNRRRYDDQLTAITTAAPVDPPAPSTGANKGPEPSNRIDWISRAQQELQRGDLRAARYSASEATERSPRDYDAWLMRSRVSTASRRIDDAIVELTEVVRLHPSAPFYAQLGNANQTAGYWGEAVAAFQEAGRLDPDPHYDLAAAQIWLSQNRPDLALPILELLSDVHPRHPDVNRALATALAETARFYLTVLTNGATIVTSKKQIADVRATIDRALFLQFDDDALRARLNRQLQEANAAAKSVWSFPKKADGGKPVGRWFGWIALVWVALALPTSLVRSPAGLAGFLGLVGVGVVVWAFFKAYRKPAWQRNAKQYRQFVQQWGI
ncbi:MAG: hypothetical protein ABWZ02_00595, partial [Nakamurella sp.]